MRVSNPPEIELKKILIWNLREIREPKKEEEKKREYPRKRRVRTIYDTEEEEEES